ncbi:hypothetical protein [Bradyrhizobium sp. WSM1253]|uniref:hypothetical protein n=1 Tax=Bradyrhizobium sp. WSM1253 TaxID=319003 RepID=UPI0012F50835|nr:hypothetical protein [Bradyrhizobium sp. WSM1253]
MAQAPASRDVRRSGGQVPSTQAWKWLTKCSGRFAQICLLIDEKLPQSGESSGELHLLIRPYGAILLTMIKNVLIAGISFATLCQ